MSGNCPFCPKDSKYESWGFSPEGWENAKRNHEENHTCKCCGQSLPKDKLNNPSGSCQKEKMKEKVKCDRKMGDESDR